MSRSDLIDTGDPGVVHDISTPNDQLPDYQGPPEPVAGTAPEWGAAAADTPDDAPLAGPALAPYPQSTGRATSPHQPDARRDTRSVKNTAKRASTHCGTCAGQLSGAESGHAKRESELRDPVGPSRRAAISESGLGVTLGVSRTANGRLAQPSDDRDA